MTLCYCSREGRGGTDDEGNGGSEAVNIIAMLLPFLPKRPQPDMAAASGPAGSGAQTPGSAGPAAAPQLPATGGNAATRSREEERDVRAFLLARPPKESLHSLGAAAVQELASDPSRCEQFLQVPKKENFAAAFPVLCCPSLLRPFAGPGQSSAASRMLRCEHPHCEADACSMTTALRDSLIKGVHSNPVRSLCRRIPPEALPKLMELAAALGSGWRPMPAVALSLAELHLDRAALFGPSAAVVPPADATAAQVLSPCRLNTDD